MTTDMINNTINANRHNPEVVTDDICDGFHTFGQLYHQRMMLFATIVKLFPELSWKTTRHEDGEKCFGGGWFLVTIDTPAGAYGYHYRMEDWDKFNCSVLERAKHWDGYTEEDVDRLFSLFKKNSEIDDSIAKLAKLTDECPCISRCTDTVIMSCASKCDHYREWLHKIKEANDDK